MSARWQNRSRDMFGNALRAPRFAKLITRRKTDRRKVQTPFAFARARNKPAARKDRAPPPTASRVARNKSSFCRMSRHVRERNPSRLSARKTSPRGARTCSRAPVTTHAGRSELVPARPHSRSPGLPLDRFSVAFANTSPADGWPLRSPGDVLISPRAVETSRPKRAEMPPRAPRFVKPQPPLRPISGHVSQEKRKCSEKIRICSRAADAVRPECSETSAAPELAKTQFALRPNPAPRRRPA